MTRVAITESERRGCIMQRPRTVAIVVGLATSVAIGGSARSARADVDFQLAGTAGAAWMRALPTLSSPSTTTAAREVPEARIPIGGSLTWAGAGFDLGATVNDRIVVPGIGIAGYGAIGSYDTVLTSADGSIARAHPWTAYRLDILLPGIGYRWKHRRFMFETSLRTGISAMYMSGSIAGGSGDVATSLSAYSAVLEVQVEACRRLDPVTRVCLQVAPRIYDFGFMNGGTLGLRVEWGR
jgi:hypothetical protein